MLTSLDSVIKAYWDDVVLDKGLVDTYSEGARIVIRFRRSEYAPRYGDRLAKLLNKTASHRDVTHVSYRIHDIEGDDRSVIEVYLAFDPSLKLDKCQKFKVFCEESKDVDSNKRAVKKFARRKRRRVLFRGTEVFRCGADDKNYVVDMVLYGPKQS